MLAFRVLAIIFVVGRCTLDPFRIPKFQTTITQSIPVYIPKTTSTASADCFASRELRDCQSRYTVTTKKISQQILPKGFPKTTLYAYGGDCSDSLTGKSLGQVYSWPGPAFILSRNTKAQITWRNGLSGRHMFTIEKNLDFMHRYLNLDEFIPNIAHIHGMANPSNTDGIPQAWFTFDGRQGDDYYSSGSSKLRNQSVVAIETKQEEAMMFYHDHSIAMTRLNVYAGLAGPFLIEDSTSPLSRIFDMKHNIFLAIADRSFNEDGSLYYPSTGPTAEFPNWVPQFYGDVMVVNGKAYPNMKVEKNRYRIKILNACNARILTISFKAEESNATLPFLLYKTDSSYQYKPVETTYLVLSGGGRAEIVLDFTGIKKRVIMRNVPIPKQLVLNPVATSTDEIMSFTPDTKVKTPITQPSKTSVLNPSLAAFPFPAANLQLRYYVLYELKDQNDNSNGVLINGVHMDVDSDIFELKKQYDLYFINLTPDVHPMHLHLVNFQHYKKAPIDWQQYTKDWKQMNGGEPPYNRKPVVIDPRKYLTDSYTMLDGVHRVWRDIANVESHTVSVFRMRLRYNNGKEFGFDVRKGRFVLHCHILEHEDNDMMRYFSVA